MVADGKPPASSAAGREAAAGGEASAASGPYSSSQNRLSWTGLRAFERFGQACEAALGNMERAGVATGLERAEAAIAAAAQSIQLPS